MNQQDARARQTMYLAKKPARSSSGAVGGWFAGKAIAWVVGTVIVLIGAMWTLWKMF